MAIIASDSGGGDFTPVPQGTHFAVCDMLVDLGKQNTTYLGDHSVKHQIYLRWQIPAERVEWTDGVGVKREGPAVIGKTYTLSLGEKANLRKDLQSWRGKVFTEAELAGFDVTCLVGIAATVSVTHTEKNGKTYANVGSIGGIPKNMDKPKAEGPTIIYDADNSTGYDDLPKWLREKVDARITEKPKVSPPAPQGPQGFDDLDDDVPF